MTYATRQDIEAIYGANHLQTLVPVDVDLDTAVSRAIEAAAAMIDPYLRKRYALPLPTVPPIVRHCAIDLACWQLAPAADRMSAEIKERAQLRLAFLRDVAAGKADIAELEALPAMAPGLDGAAESGAALVVEPRRFGRGDAS